MEVTPLHEAVQPISPTTQKVLLLRNRWSSFAGGQLHELLLNKAGQDQISMCTLSTRSSLSVVAELMNECV